MKRILTVFVLQCAFSAGILFFWASASIAGPSNDQIRSAIEQLVQGSNYRLEDFSIVESRKDVIDGRVASIEIFEAEVSAIETLYHRRGAEGGFAFVEISVEPDDRGQITGEAYFLKVDGEWFYSARLSSSSGWAGIRSGYTKEDLSTSGGRPDPRTIVVIGTPAEEEARRSLRESHEALSAAYAGAWNGSSICPSSAHNMEYRMTLEATEDPGIFVGQAHFGAGPENRQARPGAFNLRAELCSGGRCNNDEPLSVRHDSWIERQGRQAEFRFQLGLQDGELSGTVSVVRAGSCPVRFQRP